MSSEDWRPRIRGKLAKRIGIGANSTDSGSCAYVEVSSKKNGNLAVVISERWAKNHKRELGATRVRLTKKLLLALKLAFDQVPSREEVFPQRPKDVGRFVLEWKKGRGR